MPLEDPDHIDIITGPDAEGKYDLYITDSGLTTDPGERMDLLRQKLRAYLSAILDGGLAEDHPGSQPGDYRIKVACAHPPTAEMRAITAITPSGRRSPVIEVAYEEFPEGSWAASADGGEESGEEEDGPSEEFQRLIEMAFDIGAKWAEEGTPIFGLCLDGEGQPSVVQPEGLGSPDDIDPWLESWIATQGAGFQVCAFVATGQVEHEGRDIWAIVGRFYDRENEAGLILGQELVGGGPGEFSGATGEVFYIGGCPNLLG
jgi:hypothetical protein